MSNKVEETKHRVKLIKCYDRNIEIDGDYDSLSYRTVLQQIISHSDKWEELTSTELQTLRSDLWRINSSNKDKEYLIVLEDVTEFIPAVIQDIKNFVRKQRENLDKREAEERERREEAKKKREAAKLEKAKKLLAEKGLL